MNPIVWPTGTRFRAIFWVSFTEEGFPEAAVVPRRGERQDRSGAVRVCVQLPPLLPWYWRLCRCHKSSISALGRTAASAETLAVEDLGSALSSAFPHPPAVRS